MPRDFEKTFEFNRTDFAFFEMEDEQMTAWQNWSLFFLHKSVFEDADFLKGDSNYRGIADFN